MNLQMLKKEIPYQWREGVMGKQLAYITARDVMDLLDEVVKPENWQSDYKVLGDKMYCGIGINVPTPMDETGKVTWEWVWKWDMGVESNFDPEKGEASDAFKRAAVKWGIGRFLYDIKPGKPEAKTVDTPIKFGTSDAKDSTGKYYCEVCGRGVTDKVATYAKEKYGKVMCFDCQKGNTIASKHEKK